MQHVYDRHAVKAWDVEGGELDDLRQAPYDENTLSLLPFLMAYSMINRMNVKIDKSGRIVVPKVLRDRLGLKPEMELEVHEQADGMFLRVPAPEATMVRIEGLWVHQGTAQANADWASVLEDACEERLRAVGSDRAAMVINSRR